jgi:hypothetical protein
MKTLRKIRNLIFSDSEGFTIPLMVPNTAELNYRNSLAFSDMKSSRFKKIFDRHNIIFKG